MKRSLSALQPLGLLLVTALVACSGKQGPAGPTGPMGAPGASETSTATPSVSAVIPGSVFLGSNVQVTISGADTRWSAAAHPDFGAGIMVKDVVLASPTALVATIAVAPDATTGPRDITVTDGTATETYRNAFRVESTLSVAFQGTLAQGSVVAGHATLRDLTRPLDATQESTGLFGPPSYPNLEIKAGPGVNTTISSVTPFGVDFMMLIDADAPSTPGTLEVLSGPPGQAEHHLLPGAYQIAARTAVPLRDGVAATGTVSGALESSLFSFTPSAELRILDFAAETTSLSAKPKLLVLGSTGRFEDLITIGASATLVSTSTSPYTLIYWDNSNAANYSFGLTARETAATVAEPAATAVDPTHAQPISALPFLLQDGRLSKQSDAHWLQLTARAEAVGKRVHAQIVPVTAIGSSAVVTVLGPDHTKVLGHPADDADPQDFTSDPIPAAGTYFIRVTGGDPFDPQLGGYHCVVRLE